MLRIMMWILCSLCTVMTLKAAEPVPAPAPKDAGIPRGPIKAVLVEKGPAIDGTLADPIWQSTPPLVLGPVSEVGKCDLKTTARILMDDKFLYVGYECEEPDTDGLKKAVKERDGELWKDDVIEIFVSPDKEAGYKYFAINAANVVSDQSFAPGAGGDPKWNSKIESKVAIDPKKNWTVTLSIPLADLGAYVGENQTWTFNLTRSRTGGPKRDAGEQSWAILPSDRFQAPDSFVQMTGVKIVSKPDGVTKVKGQPEKVATPAPTETPATPNAANSEKKPVETK